MQLRKKEVNAFVDIAAFDSAKYEHAFIKTDQEDTNRLLTFI